jgi:hypothetical protein
MLEEVVRAALLALVQQGVQEEAEQVALQVEALALQERQILAAVAVAGDIQQGVEQAVQVEQVL